MDSGAYAEKPGIANCLYSGRGIVFDSGPQILPATIRIEVPHSKGVVMVSWPAENAATCSAFLRNRRR